MKYIIYSTTVGRGDPSSHRPANIQCGHRYQTQQQEYDRFQTRIIRHTEKSPPRGFHTALPTGKKQKLKYTLKSPEKKQLSSFFLLPNNNFAPEIFLTELVIS